MTDIGAPIRRHYDVPREDPLELPEAWPAPATPEPVREPAPVSVPDREPVRVPA